MGQQDRYTEIGKWLSSEEMVRFIGRVEASEILEIADESVTGRLNHIVIRGTAKIVGYFGADNQIELVNYGDVSLRQWHREIERTYHISLNKNQQRLSWAWSKI
jgi:hypothetical protein